MRLNLSLNLRLDLSRLRASLMMNASRLCAAELNISCMNLRHMNLYHLHVLARVDS